MVFEVFSDLNGSMILPPLSLGSRADRVLAAGCCRRWLEGWGWGGTRVAGASRVSSSPSASFMALPHGLLTSWRKLHCIPSAELLTVAFMPGFDAGFLAPVKVWRGY